MKLLKYILTIAMLLLSSVANAAINDPTDIANLVHWLDGKDINGDDSVPANGAAVNTWVDKSTSAANATLTSATSPFYDDDAFDLTNNCGGAVRFGAGAVRRLAAADVFGGSTAELTMFMVSREMGRRASTVWSINGNNTNATSNVATSRTLMHTPWSNGRIYFDFNGCCNQATTRVQAPMGTAVGDTAIITNQASLANTTQFVRVNGTTLDTNNFGSTTSTTGGLVLGSVGSRWFNGHVAEVIMYDRALTAAEISDVEDYLNGRWVDCNVDLVFNKVANDLTPTEGQNVTYTLSVTNNGSGQATTLQVLDNLPAGLTLQSLGTPSHGTIAP